MSPENCKAGALPAELHPRADLRFWVELRLKKVAQRSLSSTTTTQLLEPDGVVSGRGVQQWEGYGREDEGGEHADADHGEDAGVRPCPNHVAEQGDGVRRRHAESHTHGR